MKNSVQRVPPYQISECHPIHWFQSCLFE